MYHSYQPRTPSASHNITVTFLGTTSGGGPSETRNCSSLVIEPLGDASLWMVDCAEGTLRQFSLQPYYDDRRVKIGKLTKIFITHMHADHVAGLLTILRNILGIPKPPAHLRAPGSPSTSSTNHDPPKIEIYGPRGLRRFLRLQMQLTHTHSESSYVVHELLCPGEQASVPCVTPQQLRALSCISTAATAGEDVDVEGAPVVQSTLDEQLVENEAPGEDIACDAQGFWREISSENIAGGQKSPGRIVVDAGPIQHRDPCIGYVIRELPKYPLNPATPIPRKLVVLGDTYDPSALVPLIESPDPPSSQVADPMAEDVAIPITLPSPVSLLIHEATDAYIPRSVDPNERTGRNRTAAIVDAKIRERGHSTPAMAGSFAKRIGAERLVLNHIGARFPAPAPSVRSPMDQFRLATMREIERQAMRTWAPPHRANVQAAYDFMRVVIPPNAPTTDSTHSAEPVVASAAEKEKDSYRPQSRTSHGEASRSTMNISSSSTNLSYQQRQHTSQRPYREDVPSSSTNVKQPEAVVPATARRSQSDYQNESGPLPTTEGNPRRGVNTVMTLEQIQQSARTRLEAARGASADRAKRGRYGESARGYGRRGRGRGRDATNDGGGSWSTGAGGRDQEWRGPDGHGGAKRARP